MRPLAAVTLAFAILGGCGSVGHVTPDGDAPLPPSIESAVHRAYPGQRVVFCETRPAAANGPIHRVTLDRMGLRTWVVMDSDGKILRERAELLEADVPLAILGSVRKEFPTREIPLAIRWREDGRIHYEIRLLDPTGMTSSLTITPAGMIVEDIDGEGRPAPAAEN